MDGLIVKNYDDIHWTTVNANIQYCVRAGIVYLLLVMPQTANETDTQLGTLPDELLPMGSFYNSIFYRPSTGMSASVFVNSQSGGQIVAVTKGTSGVYMAGLVSYPKK